MFETYIQLQVVKGIKDSWNACLEFWLINGEYPIHQLM
jgi:hypothetical protein